MKINLMEGLTAGFILLVSILTFKPAYDYTIVRLLIADMFIFIGALYFLNKRRPLSLPSPILLALTGFALFVTVSVAGSVFPPATVKELPHFITYLLIFAVASQVYPTPLIATGWMAAAVILSFTGLYDYGRLQMTVTPLGNKNFFAGYLIMVIPVTITALWQAILTVKTGKTELPLRESERRGYLKQPARPAFIRHNYLPPIGLALAVILFFVLLIMADSQAAYAGLTVGLLFLVFLSLGKFIMPRLKNGSRLLLLSLLIIALALAAAAGAKKGTPYILKNVRYPLWKGSMDMTARKPITGFGPGTFLAVFQRFRPVNYYNRAEVAPLSDHSHNEYLELASESGLPALFFFLVFLASILTLSVRKLNNITLPKPKTGIISKEWFLLAGISSGLVAIMVDGLFSTNLRTFSVASVFWLLLGFCAAIISSDNVKIHPASGCKSKTSYVWAAVVIFSVFSAVFIGREIRGQVYYKDGITARNVKNWPTAIVNYRQAIALDPSNLQAAYKLSFVYANTGQTQDAIELYREILRISPNFAKTYYNLALLSLKNNDVNSAVAYLKMNLHYDPYDPESQKILNALQRTAPPKD